MSRTPLRRTMFKVQVGNEALPADRWDLHFGLDLLPSLTGTLTGKLPRFRFGDPGTASVAGHSFVFRVGPFDAPRNGNGSDPATIHLVDPVVQQHPGYLVECFGEKSDIGLVEAISKAFPSKVETEPKFPCIVLDRVSPLQVIEDAAARIGGHYARSMDSTLKIGALSEDKPLDLPATNVRVTERGFWVDLPAGVIPEAGAIARCGKDEGRVLEVQLSVLPAIRTAGRVLIGHPTQPKRAHPTGELRFDAVVKGTKPLVIGFKIGGTTRACRAKLLERFIDQGKNAEKLKLTAEDPVTVFVPGGGVATDYPVVLPLRPGDSAESFEQVIDEFRATYGSADVTVKRTATGTVHDSTSYNLNKVKIHATRIDLDKK